MKNQFYFLSLSFLVLQTLGVQKSYSFSEIDQNSNPDRINPYDPSSIERNFKKLHSKELRSSIADEIPWEARHWGLSYSTIAERASLYDLEVKFSRVFDAHLAGDQKEFDYYMARLSPSEKYDLLVGDLDATMTKALVADKERYLLLGKLEGWMGICEGSAAASIAYPEPIHPVEVPTKYGFSVKFDALDIKALASLAWSYYNDNLKIDIMGSPGEGKEFKSVNPGTFHMAIVNMIGIQKRPLVFDSSSSYTTWNTPVFRYSLKFYNPEKPGALYPDARFAFSNRNGFDNSWGRNQAWGGKDRAKNAKYLVGVLMEYEFLYTPGRAADNGEQEKQTRTRRVQYDLELDHNYNIVGGEWNNRGIEVDFVWTVPKDMRALSFGEIKNGLSDAKWNSSKPVPAEWSEAILESSKKRQPFISIVDALVELSKKKK